MIPTTLSDAYQALRMIELFMKEGAFLGSHDCHRMYALLYACKYGADLAVVETLLQWNGRKGGMAFRWHDRDTQGRTALMLASHRANTPVTKLLLDEIDIVRYAKQNHPFKVLKRAIKSGSEHHAVEVVMHRKIQASIRDPEITRFKGSGKPELSWTISKCTEAAVDRGMVDLVQVLNQLNRRKVSRAVWYMTHKLSGDGVNALTMVPEVLLRIGRVFTDAWRWKQFERCALPVTEETKMAWKKTIAC